MSTGDIAEAALRVLDEDGTDALSMRSTAARLGMSPMALYRYVDDREDLERLVTELVLASVDLEVPTRPWREQATFLLERIREAIASHPSAIPILLAHRHAAPSSLHWIEAMLSVLRSAGLRDESLVIAQRTLVAYLVGAIQSQHRAALADEGTAVMQGLSASQFPNVREAAVIAGRVLPEDEFQAGLELIFDGLETQYE